VTVRLIHEIGDPVLREEARPVPPDQVGSPHVQHLIDDMIDTMRFASGAGIAASQIGDPVRICAIEVTPGNKRYPYKPPIPLTVLVNPEITPLSDEVFESYEGCLSVPNLRGVVRRHTEIEVRGLDREGQPVHFEVRGLSAGTFQHEVDHHTGVLFVDRVTDPRTFCTWEHFRARHEQDFAARAAELVARFGS
jgi:peptide deformylase